MRFKKYHISYSKSQKNGFWWLLILTVFIQVFVYCYQNNRELVKLDVVKVSESLGFSKVSDKIYPFNPSYISDYKGYQLGMSVQEIDRLHLHRKKGLYVNSVDEFKVVTKVSDSLLKKIAPYFVFPRWVQKTKELKKKSKNKVWVVKDINKATIDDLVLVKGIGKTRAKTIVNYRELLGGYSVMDQLDEVWGIPADVLAHLKKRFKVISTPLIQKIDVNTATTRQLKSIVYINYKQAKSIIEYRKEVAEIQNLAELKTIRDFPVDKFDLISLYLQAQ